MVSFEVIGAWCGTIAAFIATLSFLPQAYQAWRTNSVRDLSWLWISMFCVSNALWVVYGLAFNLLPIITANTIILVCMLCIVYIKIKTELVR
ncbi:MAG: hypothetical protein HC836_16920 [Richelia sp. RM2_1_2]|nr:hypothetical protein [Richelia sp. RM2_1_2]